MGSHLGKVRPRAVYCNRGEIG